MYNYWKVWNSKYLAPWEAVLVHGCHMSCLGRVTWFFFSWPLVDSLAREKRK